MMYSIIAAALVEMLNPAWSIAYPAMRVGTMIIYVFLMSGILHQEQSAKKNMQKKTDLIRGAIPGIGAL